MFSNCISLTFIDLSYIQIERIENYNMILEMKNMFDGCISLTSVNIHLYFIQVKINSDCIIMNMNHMFNGCTSLNFANIDIQINEEINRYIDFFVLYLDYFFNNCSSLISVNFQYFNEKNLILKYHQNIWMNNIFSGCKYLRYINFSFPQ